MIRKSKANYLREREARLIRVLHLSGMSSSSYIQLRHRYPLASISLGW